MPLPTLPLTEGLGATLLSYASPDLLSSRGFLSSNAPPDLGGSPLSSLIKTVKPFVGRKNGKSAGELTVDPFLTEAEYAPTATPCYPKRTPGTLLYPA